MVIIEFQIFITQAKETRRVLLQLQDFNQISTNHEQVIIQLIRIAFAQTSKTCLAADI